MAQGKLISVVLFLVGSLAPSTSEAQEYPSDSQVTTDVKSRLNSKKSWAEIKVFGGWSLFHDKTEKPYPPDGARRPFDARTEKKSDGTNLFIKGVAIYNTVRTSWKFDRIFLFEGETRIEGAPVPSRDKLYQVAYADLKNGGGRSWGTLQPKSVLHIYSLEVAKDPKFVRQTYDIMHFNVEIVFDRDRGRGTVEKRRGVFRLTAKKQGDDPWVFQTQKRVGSFQKLETREMSEIRLNRLSRLDSTPLEKMFGDTPRPLPEIALPGADALTKAVVAFYTADSKNLTRFFGNMTNPNQGDYLVTEVEAVTVEPFDKNREFDPTKTFNARIELRLKFKQRNYRRQWVAIHRGVVKVPVKFVQRADGTCELVGSNLHSSNVKKTEKISSDPAEITAAKSLLEKFEAGEKVGPTGEGPKPVVNLEAPTEKAVIDGVRKILMSSVENFDALMGKLTSKTIIEIKLIEPQMKGIRRASGNQFALFIDITYTWRRFDNVLFLKQKKFVYRVQVDAKGVINGAAANAARGREKELEKMTLPRPEVKAMRTMKQKLSEKK